ncbi:MAG: GNAT family N-acetyltransferase [Polyangiales bacterium]
MPTASSRAPLRIRALTARDVDVVAGFNVAMARETESLALDPELVRRGVRAMIEDPTKGQYRLAELAGRVVGQLMITLEWSDWRCGWWWWIQSVYIAPEARRLGVYRALYESVIADAKARGDVRGVRLYVEQENHRAQATYASLGMKRGKYVFFETTHE